MKPLLRIQSKLAVLSLCLAAANVQAFYNPTQGRWLSRDPIEEGASENLSCVAGNNLINQIDPVGLFAAGVFVRYTGHGSTEIGDSHKQYIYLDDQMTAGRVPLDVGQTLPAAHIRARLDESFAASISASTDRRKLTPQVDVFMSTELRGSVDACCPCPYRRVAADWVVSASVIARGISVIARARFDGNEASANQHRAYHRIASKSVKPMGWAGCAAFSFIIDQGWTETAASLRSTSSRVTVNATFTCIP